MPNFRILSGYSFLNGATIYATSCGVTNSGTYNSAANFSISALINQSCYPGGDSYNDPTSTGNFEVLNPTTDKVYKFKRAGVYTTDSGGNIIQILPGQRASFDPAISLHTADYDYTVESTTIATTATPSITTSTLNPTISTIAGTAVAGSTVKLYKNGIDTGLSQTATGGAFSFTGLTVAGGESYTVKAQSVGELQSLPSAALVAQYGNIATSGNYTRNNCGINVTGSTVTYTVPANTYFASSQATANTLATNDVTTNGQTYANTTGVCSYTPVVPTLDTVTLRPTITTLSGNAVTGETVKLYKNSIYTGQSVTASANRYTFTGLSIEGGALYQTAAKMTTFAESALNTGLLAQYGNAEVSANFVKNNCAVHYQGSTVTYTVPANTYFASSQAAADLQASNAIAYYGQSYANANGTCSLIPTTNTPVFSAEYLSNTSQTIEVLSEPLATVKLYLWGVLVDTQPANSEGISLFSRTLHEAEVFTATATAPAKWVSAVSAEILVYKRDAEAGLIYYPMKLTRNHIIENIEALNPEEYPNRTDLRYNLAVHVPEHFLASNYKTLDILDGSEQNPIDTAGATIWNGANFDIAILLDSILERQTPNFGLSEIKLINTLTTPYRLTKSRLIDTELVDETTTGINYAIKAGIKETDFFAWKDAVFTKYFGLGKRFLNFLDTEKLVNYAQPEYLYFLTNCSPLPAKIRLIVNTYNDQGELIARTEKTAIDSVLAYSVYCIPAGVEQLGINPEFVAYYEVYLCEEHEQRISEKRKYIIDKAYNRQTRFIVYANSLGAFETLYLRGTAEEYLTVSRTISERFTGWLYMPEDAETIVDDVIGERRIMINSGWLSTAQREQLEALALSEEIYIATDRAFIPLRLELDSYTTSKDDEYLAGRMFSFVYASQTKSYSSLPNPANLPARATAWRPKSYACAWDANGRRTGIRVVSLIEQYYIDDNTRVPDSPIKANVPGTEGYLPTAYSTDCSTTPYLSAEISGVCSFVRNNCGNGSVGTAPTITVPAGLFGSETSQAEADQKAQAEYNRLNTQEYANSFGACNVPPNDYEREIPAGMWAYRSNQPSKIMLYYVLPGEWSKSYEGNTGPKIPSSSITVIPGPQNYPAYTNDVVFTVPSLGNKFGWRFLLYGTPNTPFKCEIYINGVLKKTVNRSFNLDGFELLLLLDEYPIYSQDRLYIKLT